MKYRVEYKAGNHVMSDVVEAVSGEAAAEFIRAHSRCLVLVIGANPVKTATDYLQEAERAAEMAWEAGRNLVKRDDGMFNETFEFSPFWCTEAQTAAACSLATAH